MAISTYTRAAKESDFSNIDTNNQLQRFTQNYRQDQQREDQEQKQTEATYLKQAKVDPVFNMSSYWQKQQGDKIQEFQDFLAKKYYQTKNKPGLQDLIEIQNHKAALSGWQEQVQANQQKYAQAQKKVDKDPYGVKYDKDHFQSKVDDWVSGKNGGKLDDNLLLPPRIGDRKGYYETKNWKGTKQTTVTDHAGTRHTVEVPMTDEEAKSQTKYDLFDPKNAGLYRTVTEDFAKLPNEEKKKYLDQAKEDPAQAIVDWNWDTAGKYAVKKQVKDAPAPKGRSGSGQAVTGSINYDNPSDSITIKIGTHKPGDKTSTQNQDVDVWGGYSLPGSITGVATAREFWDMSTGKKQKTEPGEDIIIKYPEIKYIPMVEDGDFAGKNTGYRDENGKLRSGFKVKAMLITRTEAGESKALELTPELKDKLATKNPKLASQIQNIPLEVNPKGTQKAEDVTTKKQVSLPKNQVVRITKDGRKAIFDSKTKKFVKYAD
jgi:hypothetical protein